MKVICVPCLTLEAVTSVKNKDCSTLRKYKRSYIKDTVLENIFVL